MAKGRHTGGLPPLEPGSSTRPIALRVLPSQYERLEALVAERGVTSSQILREALTEYLDRRKPQEAA